MEDDLTDADIRRILRDTRRIAVVGASNRPARPSFGVMEFLISKGFDVTPVNPGLEGQRLLGVSVVATLKDAAESGLDMVDIFRAADAIDAVVDEAIALGARTIWMQLGIVNHAAAKRARDAGLAVVMDRCPKLEWPRLHLQAALEAKH